MTNNACVCAKSVRDVSDVLDDAVFCLSVLVHKVYIVMLSVRCGSSFRWLLQVNPLCFSGI